MKMFPIGVIELDLETKKAHLSDKIPVLFKVKLPQIADTRSIYNLFKQLGLTSKSGEVFSAIKKQGFYSGSFYVLKTKKLVQSIVQRNRKYSFTITFIDLTSIHESNNKLIAEFKNFKNVLENAPFGYIIFKDYKIKYYNKRISILLGHNETKELKSKHVLDFISQLEYEKLQEIMLQVFYKKGKAIKHTIQIIDRFEKIKYWELTIIGSQIDVSAYFHIIVYDITIDFEKAQKQRQLAADALYFNQKNNILCEIKEELNKIIIRNKFPKTEFKLLLEVVDSYINLDKDWTKFIYQFEKVNPGFFNRLLKDFPNLSTQDLKHCACIKMNFDTSETARFFNIRNTSVQIARVRLKKKMKLTSAMSLRSFILKY